MSLDFELANEVTCQISEVKDNFAPLNHVLENSGTYMHKPQGQIVLNVFHNCRYCNKCTCIKTIP